MVGLMARTGIPTSTLRELDVDEFAELVRVVMPPDEGRAPATPVVDERAAYLAEVRRGSRVEDLPPELAHPERYQ